MLVVEGFVLTLIMLNIRFPRGQCLDRYCSYYALLNDLPIALKNCHAILLPMI